MAILPSGYYAGNREKGGIIIFIGYKACLFSKKMTKLFCIAHNFSTFALRKNWFRSSVG